MNRVILVDEAMRTNGIAGLGFKPGAVNQCQEERLEIMVHKTQERKT